MDRSCLFIAMAWAGWTELSGKTRVVHKLIYNDAENCAGIKKYAVATHEEKFDRLEAQLHQLPAMVDKAF